MTKAFATAAAVLALSNSSCIAAAADCAVPARAMQEILGRDYDAFDQAMETPSWRGLLDRGCAREAVAMLEAYRAKNAARLSLEQRLELNFHIGQTLALGGFEAESLPYFEAARSTEATAEWNAYVDATIAFLRKDRARLKAAREAYAAASSGQSMRLQVIDGFATCFEKRYAQAMHCGFAM